MTRHIRHRLGRLEARSWSVRRLPDMGLSSLSDDELSTLYHERVLVGLRGPDPACTGMSEHQLATLYFEMIGPGARAWAGS